MNLDIRTKKTVTDGIVSRTSAGPNEYVQYEPGNGSRYRLFFAKVDGAELDETSTGWVITNMNSMRSITITDNGSLLHYNYVAEKLHCGISDAVCLAEIIGHCIGREFVSCEELKNQKRYYADTDEESGDDWYVFDSAVEPHKAVSSWSSKQDAEDDTARRNEGA